MGMKPQRLLVFALGGVSKLAGGGVRWVSFRCACVDPIWGVLFSLVPFGSVTFPGFLLACVCGA